MKPARNQSTNISLHNQQLYSSPIPDPDSLAKYENIQPGFAEKIINMAENEAIHRQKKEDYTIEKSAKMAMMGIIFAFISVFLFGGIIVYAIYMQSSVAALSTVIAALASLVGIFMFFRNKSNK